MEEFRFIQTKPTVTNEDNMAGMYLSKSAAKPYHLCDLCQEGTMELEKVETNKQVADSFTKATS
jgi:hypothetical protein